MQRLLADVAAGQVDTIVVYKVDRLTLALTDFARIVEVLDQSEASFVAVTQSLNRTTSMARVTLKILLSFAQFEQEITRERIRDKISASKCQGMLVGGLPPLGYDVVNHKLVVNETEAATVRHISERYLHLGSGSRLLSEWSSCCAWTWLSPEIVSVIVDGRHADSLTAEVLLETKWPLAWKEQLALAQVGRGAEPSSQRTSDISPSSSC